MASIEEVQKLASLARIGLSQEEAEALSKDIESILTYIGQINELTIDTEEGTVPEHRNVFREDGEPHESGKFTELLTEAFPAREKDALKVKKIISHDE